MTFEGILVMAIILSTMTIELIVNGIADYLNLKVVQEKLPDEFKGLYSRHRYRKSQMYLRVNTRFKWVSEMVLFACRPCSDRRRQPGLGVPFRRRFPYGSSLGR